MARVKFNSLKDLIAAQGPIATVPAPKQEKQKVESAKAPKTDLPMPVIPKRVKKKKAGPRPVPSKDIRYAEVQDYRIKPAGMKEVSKPDQTGMSELGHFKNQLDMIGLELFGCEVRKKKEFADEFFSNATETPTQREKIKEFQALYDSKFRVKH